MPASTAPVQRDIAADGRAAGSLRPFELVRGAWGLACLVAPRRVAGVAGSGLVDHRAVVVMRILGVRHLVQAALSAWAPGSATLAVGVWVDTVHSITAVVFAAVDRPRAPQGLVGAVIAAAWALAGSRDVQRPEVVGSGADPSAPERLARAVLPWLLLAPAAPLPDGAAGRR